jgi:hypothetical protein
MVAQPSIAMHEPFALRPASDLCPVERTILQGLGRLDAGG